MPDLDINEDFTPEACSASAGAAVTYGAGQTGRDMYQKLDGTGYFVSLLYLSCSFHLPLLTI